MCLFEFHLSVGENGEYFHRRFVTRLIFTPIHLHFGE